MAGNDIERYVPQGELSTRGAQELAAVGLSPDFPARVQELNNGLTYLQRGTFTGLRFNLRPDEDFPKVDVEARHVSPYTVSIEARINGQASLDIRRHPHHPAMLAMLGLHQVKTFTDTYPTDETILFSASPRHTDEPYRGRKLQAVRDEPFAGITTAADLEGLGIVPNRYDVEIGFETRKSGLKLAMSYPEERRSAEPVLMLHSFHAHDTAARIEHVTGSLGLLLTQNWNISVEGDSQWA